MRGPGSLRLRPFLSVGRGVILTARKKWHGTLRRQRSGELPQEMTRNVVHSVERPKLDNGILTTFARRERWVVELLAVVLMPETLPIAKACVSKRVGDCAVDVQPHLEGGRIRAGEYTHHRRSPLMSTKKPRSGGSGVFANLWKPSRGSSSRRALAGSRRRNPIG